MDASAALWAHSQSWVRTAENVKLGVLQLERSVSDTRSPLRSHANWYSVHHQPVMYIIDTLRRYRLSKKEEKRVAGYELVD